MSDDNETRSTETTSDSDPDQKEPRRAPLRKTWLERLREADLNEKLGANLGLDLRSIAVFRIAMGLLVVSDVWHRSLHLRAHYADVGFMPRDRLLGGWSQTLFYSFHNWGGDVPSQVILFVITAVFGLMLLFGFKTRLASVMCFVMVASVHGRNYLILQGGDDLLRVMLFWGMFVPLGARLSLDAALAKTNPGQLPKRVFSVGSMTLALQLLAMYTVSAVLKTGPTWHAQGSAIHLALHHHAFATEFGIWFREMPTPLLQYLTWSTYYLELVGPLLFFLPYRNDWARTLQVLLFVSFHFGLYLTMELGHFPWVAMGAWLVMLPSWFWENPVRRVLSKLDPRARLSRLSERTETWLVGRRHWLGSMEPRAPRIKPTLLGSILCALLAVYTTYGTAYAAAHRGDVKGDQFNPMLILRLYANWGMFAPNPPNTSGWFVMVGERKDGKEVDIWNDNMPVDWEKPELPSATYRTQRWRKFLDNIVNPRHAVVRPYFLKWLCREWNERHEGQEQIRSVTMYHMTQSTKFPEKGYTPLKKENLQRQACPAISPKRTN